MSETGTTTVEYIPVDQITPSPHQHRQMPDEERMWELIEKVEQKLENNEPDKLTLTNEERKAKHVRELAQSIGNGELRIPIGVRPTGEGYELRYGEFRWWAHRFLERAEIKAIISDVSDEEHTDEGFLENNLREDPNVLEQGYGVYDMFQRRGIELPPEEIANKLKSIRAHDQTNWNGERPPGGREAFVDVCDNVANSPRTIARWLRAIAVCEEVQERVPSMEQEPRAKVFERLHQIDNDELQLRVFEKIHEQGWTIEDSRTVIKWAHKKEEHNQAEEAKTRLAPKKAVSLHELRREIDTIGSVTSPNEPNEIDPNPELGQGQHSPSSPAAQENEDVEQPERHIQENERELNKPTDQETQFLPPDVFHKRAEELLPELPDNSVDCIVTDPPYGGFVANWEESEDLVAQDPKDDIEFMRPLVREFERVLTPNSHLFVFCDGEHIDEMKRILDGVEQFEFDHLLTWVKDIQSAKGGYWKRKKEQILAYKYGMGGIDRSGMHIDVLEFDGFAGGHDEEHIHENQKPRDLLEELIEISSERGDVVLDPFGGSYSTARAAMVTGRKAISCESNEEAHQRAAQLVEEELAWEQEKQPWQARIENIQMT